MVVLWFREAFRHVRRLRTGTDEVRAIIPSNKKPASWAGCRGPLQFEGSKFFLLSVAGALFKPFAMIANPNAEPVGT